MSVQIQTVFQSWMLQLMEYDCRSVQKMYFVEENEKIRSKAIINQSRACHIYMLFARYTNTHTHTHLHTNKKRHTVMVTQPKKKGRFGTVLKRIRTEVEKKDTQRENKRRTNREKEGMEQSIETI